MSWPSREWEYRSEHSRPPSFAGPYSLIAKQNQRTLFPFLIESDSRVKESLKSSSLYHHVDPLPPLPPRQSDSDALANPIVHVVPADSFDCAGQLVCEGKKDIVVLNMANAWMPGGDYFGGAGAQEEALCRRSTLYLTIRPGLNFHPIPSHGAIYSPDVLVFRKSDIEGCVQLLPEEQWWTSVISVAAISRPDLNAAGDDFKRKSDREDARKRIRTVLRVAALERRKNLVLGALGCGAFKNPPKVVARLFKDVLGEKEFSGRFEGIWFSVIERAGSENYEIFKEALDGMEIK